MIPSTHKRLACWFWLCWLGTVLIPVTFRFPEILGGYGLLTVLFAPCLCFACARCVRFIPRLAKIGMFTLAAELLLIPLIAIVYHLLRGDPIFG
jgi:hypothetical protein